MKGVHMERQQQPPTEPQEVNLFEYFLILAKRKRLIAAGAFGFAVLALVVCLVMSPIFEATTRLMPPQESGGSAAGQLLAQLGGAAGIVLGGGGSSSTGELFAGLLQTDPVVDAIIDRFDLVKLFDVSTRDEARMAVLLNVLRVEVDPKNGILSVTAADTDPRKAADMANAFVEELKKLLGRIAVTESSKKRVFFETQLKQAHEALSKAEEAIQGFQESTGAIKIDDQAAALLQQYISLRAAVVSKEVQLQVMKTYATANNPDLKRAEQELRALKEQLSRLEESGGGQDPNLIIPTDQIPTLGKEFIRKMRDFKYQEMLYELLVKQYEAARLEEARDAIIVQVINQAVPPERKARPKTRLVVLIAGATGFFLFILAALFLEFFERASADPENRNRMTEIRKYLRRF